MTDAHAVFGGFSAFPLTPADPDGRVRLGEFAALVDRAAGAGVSSLGVLGSTGSYAFLSREERARAASAAVEAAQGRVPVIVGVGALRTDAAIALAQDAARAGADGLLLAPVSYTPLLEDEVFAHYRAVAEATDRPLCIYNNPGSTHFQFSNALLSRIAALSNVAAVKMPLPAGGTCTAEIDRLRPRLPKGFVLGYSGDPGCAQAMLDGADAWYSAIGGTLVSETLALYQAAAAGDAAEVDRQMARFAPLWDLIKRYGSLRVAYAVAGILGLTDAQPPRPILPVPTDGMDKVHAALGALRPET